ncbi:putative signal transduction histidine kinase [Acidothermus cellulolyticus 11B]|uniref:Putative signal transduction histidine kinase n=1 Tax=Acidothermus cellulolyticus (strain ATCC 43068 / DSM 8971 / 11B) TaxID=351607 RepID=A0LTI7_ACIC1|nr:sensor histidine kinase [Acidothermus cellulolyticus]ABK52747.1 putative signal transduction histidine kinase [Acidothermus cellulolyticus 11B]
MARDSARTTPGLPWWTGARFDTQVLVLAVRLAFLGLSFVVAALDPDPRRTVAGALVLALAAGTSLLPIRAERWRHLLPTVEAVIAAVGIIAPPGARESLLPYLLAPAFAAGLRFGLTAALVTPGAAAVVLFAGYAAAGYQPSGLPATASQWILLALAVGALAAWIRRLTASSTSDVMRSYHVAHALLQQLRDISRQLSEGLDAVAVAHGLLHTIRSRLAFGRGAVLIRSDGGHLVALAVDGAPDAHWVPTEETSLTLRDALADQRAVTAHGRFGAGVPSDGTPVQGWQAVYPLRVGDRQIGAVVLDGDGAPPGPALITDVDAVVEDAGIRLETALLFGEVRSLATTEERRRLAREIHDGIAQELASLGYRIDDQIANATAAPGLAADLRAIRADVSRLITELRLSIFDLRSEVGTQTSLGAALADYVRSIGPGIGLAVHVILDESVDRLPIPVETELLRIAQEAITNARRHAGATNLWIRCRVDPPFAHLRVEDDGRGLGPARLDSFGLEVMHERADRIGATLSISPRPGGGTIVEVRLGDHYSEISATEQSVQAAAPTGSAGANPPGGTRIAAAAAEGGRHGS